MTEEQPIFPPDFGERVARYQAELGPMIREILESGELDPSQDEVVALLDAICRRTGRTLGVTR